VTENWPRISIVTPCLNQVEFIEQTIRSVLDQGYPNLEYIVIDGGSTDGTVEVIELYADQLAFFVSEPDAGQAAAINKGFTRATGDVLAYINSDDYYLPGAFQRVAEEYIFNPFGVLCGGCQHVDEGGTPIQIVHGRVGGLADLLDARTYRHAYLTQPEVFWSTTLARAAGPFSEALNWAFDFEFWVRAVHNGADVRTIEADLACFRRHPAQKTLGQADARAEEVDVIRDYRRDPSMTTRDRRRVAASLRWLRSDIALTRAKAARVEGRALRCGVELGVAVLASPWTTVRRLAEH
jgi:glycosyltransferase involved in cell wall biosynthesis